MTTAPRHSREIDGTGRTIRELLAEREYSIDCYQREYKTQQKRGFRRFIEASGLNFRANAKFRKADLGARQVLHQRLANRIGSTERLGQEAGS